MAAVVLVRAVRRSVAAAHSAAAELIRPWQRVEQVAEGGTHHVRPSDPLVGSGARQRVAARVVVLTDVETSAAGRAGRAEPVEEGLHVGELE